MQNTYLTKDSHPKYIKNARNYERETTKKTKTTKKRKNRQNFPLAKCIFWDDRNVLYLVLDGDNKVVYNCQTVKTYQNEHLKAVYFIVCKL